MPLFTAIATPGLEPVTARELAGLGVEARIEPGGVLFEGPATLASLAARLWTPSRLLLQIAQGRTVTLEQLAALVRGGDWRAVLSPGDAVEVTATAHHSRLHIRNAIERKVKHAVQDVVGRPREQGGATQRVSVRLDEDVATISVDSGGELLHRRGWRLATAKAPLRENLAAAMLLAAGWEHDEPLLDPFCGAGTLPIEAARMAMGLPPGQGRSYGFQDWPSLGDRRQTPLAHERRPLRVPIVGADRDPGAIRASTENAARALVPVDWRHVELSRLEAPAPVGLVATNPPYGQRVGGEDAGGAYALLGRALRGPLAGWRAIFLAPHADLARKVDREAQRLTVFANGGIKVGLWAVEGRG